MPLAWQAVFLVSCVQSTRHQEIVIPRPIIRALGRRVLLACCCLAPLAPALAKHGPSNETILGLPSGDWPFVYPSPTGARTYLIPSQLGALKRLPEPDRSRALHFVREHEANLRTLRRTGATFFEQLSSHPTAARPEYYSELREAVMAVDAEQSRQANPIFAHEPVLLALPPYSRVTLFVPVEARQRVRERLRALGLTDRVRVRVSAAPNRTGPDGRTRWIRDTIFATYDADHTVVYTSLAHKNSRDVAHDDLGYVKGIKDRRHLVVRMPVFFRGGNLALAENPRRILLIGSDELAMNRQWFLDTFGFEPLPDTVQTTLRLASRADEVVVLPNTRNFYHLDMYLAPIAKGKVALLAPQDPEQLAPNDRRLLDTARQTLNRLGLQIVDVPTRADWIRRFESPTNVVSFIDRNSQRPRTLVPQFPEPAGGPGGLNAAVQAAYRAAGIEPVPVEDRFHDFFGNTHCALVALL